MNEHEVASQHITVTVALAGSQHVTIDTHATDGPGSHLSVAYASVIIWLHDLRAVNTYGRVWTETAASIYAGRLPQARELNVPAVGGYSPTIGIHATGSDQVDIYPQAQAVIVKIGHVSWAVYDRDAFDHQVALWHRVAKIARLTLPGRFDNLPGHTRRRR